MKIKGTFEVKLSPLEYSQPKKEGLQIGRLSIHKTYHGKLAASSVGEMLSARSSTPGMAGYVAIEQVSGTLDGKKGSFAIQHFGTMSENGKRLMLEVVPGSGTHELKNLSGKMDIKIDDGQHYYELEYELG